MKVIIIDDEQAMLAIMQRMLRRIENIEIIGGFQSVKDALLFTQNTVVDIAFVDIMIADESGLELARQLRAGQKNMEIVFVTSHREYAVDAFDTYPLDYMVKPVSQKRLIQTIERAREKNNKPPEKMDVNRLIVKALGGLEVSSVEAGKVKFISKKSQELFAFLLLGRDRAVSRDRVIDKVFPEMPLENAVAYLNTAVYQLRKALQSHGLKSIVRTFNEQYMLEMTHIDADFISFESYVYRVKDWNEFTVKEALEWEKRFAGDLYENKFYTWSIPEQEGLAIRYHDFAIRLVRWLLANNQVTQSILIARKIVSRNELDEEANVFLMKAYRAAKDYQSFRSHYEHFIKVYQKEIGSLPSIGEEDFFEK